MERLQADGTCWVVIVLEALVGPHSQAVDHPPGLILTVDLGEQEGGGDGHSLS